MSESGWRILATYASGFEADIAMAQLEAADIPAVRDSNDSVGILGPGFQGTTPKALRYTYLSLRSRTLARR